MIKTFRGLLESGAQECIRLETLDGKTGYRIKKFELIARKPGTTDYEHIVKLFSIKQTVIDEEINFSEITLLAAGFTEGGAATNFIGNPLSVIFDSVTFNQDIFVTQFDSKSALPCNYYLELEQIRLDDVEATAVILKNFRNTNTV